MTKPLATEPMLERSGRALWFTLSAEINENFSGEKTLLGMDQIDIRLEFEASSSQTLIEVIQHLTNLGFLSTLAKIKGGILKPSLNAIADALADYREEERSFASQFSIKRARGWSISFAGIPHQGDALVMRSDEIVRMRALTSFDGALGFSLMPLMGEKSLASRVAHHLLRSYGILPKNFASSSPWSDQSEAALRCITRLLKRSISKWDALEALNFITDFDDAVIDSIMTQGKEWDIMIPSSQKGDWAGSLIHQNHSSQRFREALDRTLQGEYVVFDQQDRNVFGVLMLQMFLWQWGHYFGALDAIWGAESDSALHRYLEAHLPANYDESSVSSISSEVNHVICIRFAEVIGCCHASGSIDFGSISNSPDAVGDLASLQAAIRREVIEMAKGSQAKHTEIATQEASVWNRLFDEVDDKMTLKSMVITRRNFGMLSLGRGVEWLIGKMREIANKVVNAMVSFAKRVAEFVSELIGNLSGVALQAIQFLKRGLSGALRVATQAGRRVLRLMRGEPFAVLTGENRWIITHFSLDQDAVTFCASGLTEHESSIHFDLIREENRSLEKTLRVGLKVLKIAATCTPPMVGLSAIGLAMDLFRALSGANAKENETPLTKALFKGTMKTLPTQKVSGLLPDAILVS